MSSFYNRFWKDNTNELEDFHYKWPVISRLIPRDKNIKILDHGCGTGKTFGEVVKINPHAKYCGVDISDYAIKIISKKFPKYKFYQVDEGKKIPVKDGSIDLITSFDVIEHIYNTDWILKDYSRLLKHGGKLFLTTPYYGLIKNIIITLVGFETVFDPYGPHIRFFTYKSLKRGLDKYGLEIEKMGFYGRIYPFSNGRYVIARKK